MTIRLISAATTGKCSISGCTRPAGLSIRSLHGVARLPDDEVATFRDAAFSKAIPHLLPKDSFKDLPASRKWFKRHDDQDIHRADLNREYLSAHAKVTVPVEITAGGRFTRLDQPLSFFLEASRIADESIGSVYVAQAPISDLPKQLQEDLPTPQLVLEAGKGDIYDSSIWLGRAPTYTPLHRDPNPNLFVQLAGTKRVRICSPEVGGAIFAHVQQMMGRNASASMRGEEMMQGEEKAALEEAVWGEPQEAPWQAQLAECEVEAGDGLFIPKGWWHSIKGIGTGMTGSVNWWFR